jgi:Mce-associated membrane protein
VVAVADADKQQESAKAKADAIARAEEAEAEAAEAEALAAAARARARAIKLRRQAEAQTQDAGEDATAETPEATETTEAAEPAETPEPPTTPTESTPRRLRVPRIAGFSRLGMPVAAATIVVTCALLGASGWMLWHHHTAAAERQQRAAYVAAARQGVINLTSLDFNHAQQDVQRVLDSGTGEFRDEFQRVAGDFASVVKDSKAVTEGSVKAAAVESMSDNSAVVLLLGNERITNSAGAKNDPRVFRFRVTVTRDGDQLKISKVEYVI